MNVMLLNPLNAELNPIYHLLALLGAHHILHISRIRVNLQIMSHYSKFLKILEKCSWVKCSEVLQCSDVLLVLFYRFVYGCMFCILLCNSVSLLLYLHIFIDKYALFCILFANWHSPVFFFPTLTEVF